MKNTSLILASASPRRSDILKRMGIAFEVIVSNVDEKEFLNEQISPGEFARQAALAKALDVACEHPQRLTVGFDTVVDFQGKLIGKPENREDAKRILEMIFSEAHQVITAVAAVCPARKLEIVDAETTTIYPGTLTGRQIEQYLDSGQWQGKAGAYGLQNLDDEFVERIEGSFDNVVGLPSELLLKIFAKIGAKLAPQ